MDTKNEVLKQVLERLVDIKMLLSLCEKGLDADGSPATGESYSVMRLVEGMIGEVITKIDAVVD